MKNFNRGFTLVEMIVSIAIFFIVAIVAVGAVLKVLDANKKAQNIKTSISNLNFALDTMGRDLRVGTNYYCQSAQTNAVNPDNNTITGAKTSLDSPQSCPPQNGSWMITFNSSKTSVKSDGTTPCSIVYAFYFDKENSALWKGTQSACDDTVYFYPLIYNNVNDTADAKNSDAVLVFTDTNMKVVTETTDDAKIWPYVQVYFSGYTGLKDKVRNYFNIQTMFSQRLPD